MSEAGGPSEQILERAEVHAHVPAPALVVLPDPEARVEAGHPLWGRTALQRLTPAALAAGFGAVVLGPGTRVAIEGATELATGEPLNRPALIVFEESGVHPELLQLMVAHPLEPDERYTLYDEAGRPAACFVGSLAAMPSLMPVTEELPWPESLGPADVVRVVYAEDRARAEALILRADGVAKRGGSKWREAVELRTLRLMTNSGRPLPQLELIALAFAISSLPLALLATHLGLVLAALALLLGVHGSSLLPLVRSLRARDVEGDDRLAHATRPLGQAALTGGLTYVIVAETDRSGVAATVLLAAGAAAVLLCLVQARLILQGRPADVFALPDAHAVAARLGFRWPTVLDGAPFLELFVLVAALPGVAELPWSALAGGAIARLWRWFAGGGPISLGRTVAGRVDAD